MNKSARTEGIDITITRDQIFDEELSMVAFHHIGIAVEDIEKALEPFRLLGLEVRARGVVEAFRVEVCFLSAGSVSLELLSPRGDGPVKAFLEKRGPGLHHLAFAVPDLQATLKHLKAAGVRLVDESPRPGFGGHRVAFLHPRSFHGVLVELVEEG